MGSNYYILFIAALIPLFIGFFWYGPLFKNAWMKEMSFSEENLKGGNMLLIFGLSYLLGLFIASALMTVVIHQTGVYSTLAHLPSFKDTTSETYAAFTSFMEKYGHIGRTFKHGSLHGGLIGVFLVMPVLAIQAMFERKSFKYIAINAGYWIITLSLMGGVISQWL